MNAQEAAALATKVVTEEQKSIAETAMGKIRAAAEIGAREVYMSPIRIKWLKTYLESEGYTCVDQSNQREGATLKVSW